MQLAVRSLVLAARGSCQRPRNADRRNRLSWAARVCVSIEAPPTRERQRLSTVHVGVFGRPNVPASTRGHYISRRRLHADVSPRAILQKAYRLSNTWTSLKACPFSLVPLVVMVMTLPSFEITRVPVATTLPAFFCVNSAVNGSIRFNESVSATGLPVSGRSLPS